MAGEAGGCRSSGVLGVSALHQYALLFGMVLATVGFVLCLAVIARSLAATKEEGAKDVPAASGELSPEPVWVRYHVRYYGYALLFLAFDMEMAYMYPWAVVYRELGLVALLEMGVFLAILFLGLLYGWSQGALRRQ
ncbi:NADH-quinone oxidoreductase subunit A [Rubrobacter taiwanensis]|uniref:NADH-quinone oxidoreductase subunit A n=1 Tax=Rubrobacter taiwanensis TaxID=185139 RepID=UPI001FB4D294|nr:NADH-quinone oxidoreductase subunit A [Rubrobacter taiwanensis]